MHEQKENLYPPLVTGTFSLKENSSSQLELIPPKNALYMCRKARSALGNIAFVGHCISTEEQIVERVELFEKTGDLNQLTHLLGSYITIIVGPSEVTILADLSGQFPLYYSTESDEIRYSSSIQVLAARCKNIRGDLNVQGIAAEILSELPCQTFTPYRNIYRLPGGHILKLTSSGATTESYDALIPKKNATYINAVRELRDNLCASISARMLLGHQVGTDFSGGLDSSSLAFLAVRMLDKDQQIKSFHSRHIEEISGDLPYAERFSQLDHRIDLRIIVDPADTLPYQNLQSYQRCELPNPLATNNTTINYLREVVDSGCEILLSGVCGDALFSVHATYLADLYRMSPLKNWIRIIRDITLMSQLAHVSSAKVLRWVRKLSKITLKQSLHHYADVLHYNTQPQPAWNSIDQRGIQLLSHHSRSTIGDFLREKADSAELSHVVGVADWMAIQGVRESARSFVFRREFAERLGLQIHTPYLDHAVIRSCLRVAAYKRSKPSHFKSILRDALQGLVPEEIFQRRSKGSPVSEDYQGVRRQAANLRVFLGPESHLAKLNIIVPKAIDSAINRIELGLDKVPTRTLLQAASTELWLRSHFGQSQPLPLVEISQEKVAPKETGMRLPLCLFVAEHVKFVADIAGLVGYNLRTGRAVSFHVNAAKVIQLFQYAGSLEKVISLLQDANPAVDKLAISQDIHGIAANLVREGIFVSEGSSAFTITRATRNTNELAADVPMNRGDIDTSEVQVSDYLRMGRSLLRAIRLLRSADLAMVTSTTHNLKRDLPPAKPSSVRRLMAAGHVLKRWYPGRVACLELSLATVLAEAKRGRSVDLCIGTAPDPRRYHAWPEIAGVPIQTPRDEIVEGQFTKFGMW